MVQPMVIIGPFAFVAVWLYTLLNQPWFQEKMGVIGTNTVWMQVLNSFLLTLMLAIIMMVGCWVLGRFTSYSCPRWQ